MDAGVAVGGFLEGRCRMLRPTRKILAGALASSSSAVLRAFAVMRGRLGTVLGVGSVYGSYQAGRAGLGRLRHR